MNLKEKLRKERFGEIDPRELPREKLKTLGAAELTDAELLAIVLRTGTKDKTVLELSEELLSMSPHFDGLVGLTHFTLDDYQRLKGVGQVKAIELSAIGEISKRIWRRNIRKDSQRFLHGRDVFRFYKEDMRFLAYEVVRVLYLDNQMQLIREIEISRGTCNQSAISPRDIFIEAFRIKAVCMIMVHNHPSGLVDPSDDDILVTEEVRKAGEWIGISLIDHIIIGDNQYFSFKEQGLI